VHIADAVLDPLPELLLFRKSPGRLDQGGAMVDCHDMAAEGLAFQEGAYFNASPAAKIEDRLGCNQGQLVKVRFPHLIEGGIRSAKLEPLAKRLNGCRVELVDDPVDVAVRQETPPSLLTHRTAGNAAGRSLRRTPLPRRSAPDGGESHDREAAPKRDARGRGAAPR
jgi:hypothetical protein